MNLVFLGSGGHAKSIIPEILDFINISKAEINVLGYTDNKNNGNIFGLHYLGTDTLIPSNCKIINCIGSTEKSDIRMEIFTKYKKNIVGFISQKAIISKHSSCFQLPCFNNLGLQIMQGAIINSGSQIGENTIINSGAIIEHDVIIGASSHIAPGATICGGVQIGNNVHVGAGSVIIQNVNIINNVIIGAGSVVLKSITKEGTYFGNPAKIWQF